MAAYTVDYNDKRLTQVEADKKAAQSESDKLYDSMIKDSEKVYNQQAEAVENYGKEQSKLQQEKTDFAIEQIEQQKEQAKSDYLKEQSASYTDWQKQSNQYGTNAEKQADMGLAHTGYSESSQVSMYNTYQNRVATAREAYTRAVLNYDNAIKDAQLQNNSVLAEIAYNTLQKSLELSLQGFQYKNTLVLEKASKKAEIDDRYYNRYQNVLSQINYENSQAEQIRQYNETLAEQKRQHNENLAFSKEQFEWQKKNSSVSRSSSGGGSRGGSGGGSGSGSGSGSGYTINKQTSNTNSSSYKKQTLNETQKHVDVSSVKTSSDAKKLLDSYGVKPSVKIIDSVTWNKAKRLGDGGSDVQNFDKYSDYAQAYVKGALKGKY